MTMDVEVKARWLEALRSGDYKQGKHWLEKNGCNCCLGVLAKIEGVPMVIEHFNDGFNTKYDYGQFNFGEQSASEITYPPDGWMGIDHDTLRKLASKNDSGHTFEQIADYIEEKL